MYFRFLWLFSFFHFFACQEEKSKPQPISPPSPPVVSQPAPPPKVEVDFSVPCQKLVAKLSQCKQEIIQQKLLATPDALIATCKKTLHAEAEKSDTLKLLDLLHEQADPNSCRGAINTDCSIFMSCLVTRRRNEVCNSSQSATIRISTQEIQLNGKTVVFLAGTQIAGQTENTDEIAPLAQRIAEVKNTGVGAVCINADPDVPWIVVDRVSRTARHAGLTRQALISQQLTQEKAGVLLETAAEDRAWTLPDDLLPWGVSHATAGTDLKTVTIHVTPDGYDVFVDGKSLCPVQNRRGKPCIPQVTVDGQTVHNPVALRQFLYEYHVRPFWKAQNLKPGENLPSVGDMYLHVTEPSIPYKVITSTLDGLRVLPESAKKEWNLSSDVTCRLQGDWFTKGRVEQVSGACFYPVVYQASQESANAMVESHSGKFGLSNPPINTPTTPNPMFATPSMLEASSSSSGNVGATDTGLIPAGAPLEVRQWLTQKKWAIVACFQKAGARGFAHQGSVSVTMEMSQGIARVLSMGGTLASIPSFLQCSRDMLHQKTVGSSEDTHAFTARWTFTLQLKGALSE